MEWTSAGAMAHQKFLSHADNNIQRKDMLKGKEKQNL